LGKYRGSKSIKKKDGLKNNRKYNKKQWHGAGKKCAGNILSR